MGLLDGDVAAAFSAIFSGFYLDGWLYRSIESGDDGMGGGSNGGFAPAEAIKFQPEATTQAMRDSPGYVDTDKRYLILAHGVAEPNTDAELEAEGKRWKVVTWSRDPAASYYDLHCRYLRDA